jgi:hypothetical protein
MFLAGGLLIWAVVAGAMSPRKARDSIAERPQEGSACVHELKEAIDSFNHACNCLEIALHADDERRAALLATLPSWARPAISPKSTDQACLNASSSTVSH